MRQLFFVITLILLTAPGCTKDKAADCIEKCSFTPPDLCPGVYNETVYYYNRVYKTCMKTVRSPCDGDQVPFKTLKECKACGCE